MFKWNLRKKTLAGYIAVVLLIVIVGAISIIQSGSLGKKVEYLTKEVAGKVKLASEIESNILSMQTSVEKYIYRNREEDKLAAEANIAKVIEIIAKADKDIKSPQQSKIVKGIDNLTRDYIDKYHKVVIRYKALDKSKHNISSTGREIQEGLENLSEGRRDDIVRSLMTARIEMESFMANYDSLHSQRAKVLLTEILEMIGEPQAKEMEEIKFSIEDYMDDFEGLVSVTAKMDQEVKETILPLAPRIIGLAKEISTAGWDEMDTSRVEVDKKVSYTGKAIATIMVFAIILALGIGFVSASSPYRRLLPGSKT